MKKPTKYVTNSKVIAEMMDQYCKNDVGVGPIHRHVELIGGIAHFAAKYPPALVKAVLRGLRLQLLQDGSLSELDLKVGGPVLSEPICASFDENVLAEAISYYANISGEELPWRLERKRS